MKHFLELELRPQEKIVAFFEQMQAMLELVPNHTGALYRLELLIDLLNNEIDLLATKTIGSFDQVGNELMIRSSFRNVARDLVNIREKQIIKKKVRRAA